MNTAFVDELRFIPCPKAHLDKQMIIRKTKLKHEASFWLLIEDVIDN